MKKFILILLVAVSFCVSASAQQKGNRRQAPSFEQFMQEKMSFIFNEMNLSEADSVKFAPLYLELQQAKMDMMKKYGTLRPIYRKIRHNEPVTDDEYSEVVLREAERLSEEASLDLAYISKFKAVLTAKQLYAYQMAERKYKVQVMSRGQRNQQAK